MTASFLLRFQEPCDEAEGGDDPNGTKTVTKVAQEGKDADPMSLTCRSIPFRAILAGTATGTLVQSEQADADRHSISRTIPIQQVMGTTTKTAVKLEGDDQDPRQIEMTALPRCFSF